MPSDSADRSSSRIAGVAATALGASPADAMPALPGRSVPGNIDDLTTTAAPNSPATATDPDGVTGTAPKVGGAYIYGYDFSGNPTLTDAACYCSSEGKLPD